MQLAARRGMPVGDLGVQVFAAGMRGLGEGTPSAGVPRMPG
jgi:hypothetical protein